MRLLNQQVTLEVGRRKVPGTITHFIGTDPGDFSDIRQVGKVAVRTEEGEYIVPIVHVIEDNPHLAETA